MNLAPILTKILHDPAKVDEVREFQPAFVDTFRRLGWAGWHPRDVERAIAVEPGPDKPVVLDWWMVRDQRAMWVELKAERGRLSGRQMTAILRLERAGIEVHVFRPSQWDTCVVPCLMARGRWGGAG